MFLGKRKTALKVLFFNGSGMCPFHKRLDRRTFRAPDPPRAGMTSIELSERELDDLLDGIDVDLAPESPRVRKRMH